LKVQTCGQKGETGIRETTYKARREKNKEKEEKNKAFVKNRERRNPLGRHY